MRNSFRHIGFVFGILAVALTVSVSSVFAQANNRVEQNFTDFSDISSLTLSGSTQGYGNPINVGGQNILRLTNASGGQAGGAFLSQAITLQNDASFSTYFTFRMSSPGGFGDGDGVGADGLAFVVQSESNQFGGAGGGLGYVGLDNSVGIEFDTYNNGDYDGHNGNHVGIDIDGDLNSVQRYNVGTRMNNGAVWHAWVDYNGASQVLEVRIAESDSRPGGANLSHNVDLSAVLGQDDAYVGFTAATGGAYEIHDILSWYFVNEFEPIVEAPARVSWQGNGHLYQAIAAAGITWQEANDLANAMSYTDAQGNYWYAHLATVSSQAENDFITNTFPAAMQWIYWLGGYQVHHNNEPAGGWAWVTGEPWDFTNWQPGEPNDYAGNQEEVLMFYGGSPRWNDITITYQGYGYVVEWEILPQTPPGVAWEGNGHYYYPVAAAGLTWPQANDAANAMSFYDANGNYWYAHLLTVTSTEENQFIVDNFVPQMQQLYFLGGHQVNFDNEPAGGWAWVTGEPWVYTNWGFNEPNNQFGTEQIIHFWNLNGGWNDHQIYWQGNGFIVEYEMQAPAAPAIVLSTDALDFGGVLVNSSSDLLLQISNEGDADLTVTGIAATGEGFSTDFDGEFTVAPGGQHSLTVTFAPAAFGSANGTITITSDDPANGSLEVSLSGEGIGPIIAVDPASLNFGDVEFRRSSELTFDICNEGTAEGIVSDLTVSGANFSTDYAGSFSLQPGECVTITVGFEASSLGSSEGTIVVTSDDPFNNTTELSLSGNGVWVPSTTLLRRLCERVDALRSAGDLNRGQANSLCVKLNNATRALQRNQPRTALNVLNAFKNEVADLIARDVLSDDDGQPLIAEANFISSLISEFGVAGQEGREVTVEPLPEEVMLYGGYPNPFNASSHIRFGLPEVSEVRLSLFDLTGREVISLISGRLQAGFHSVTIQGDDLRSGMYIVRLNALGRTQSSRITYIR